MVVTRVVGRLEEVDLAGRRIERIYLDADAMARAHQRTVTDAGTEVGISLSRGTTLRRGDVVYVDADRVIVVEGIDEDVLVVRPGAPLEWGLVGFHLGNRHCQPFFEGSEVLVRYDHTVEELLREIGVDFERSQRRLSGVRPVVHAH
jgi:urease accessory protein